jgi:hypothetical protein
MKHILILLLLLALCVGCATTTSQYTVVNNTPYVLKVYQDGEYQSDLQPGMIHRVRGTLLGRNTVVTVTGFDSSGAFLGSDSYIYQFGVPTAWTVSTLNTLGNVPRH